MNIFKKIFGKKDVAKAPDFYKETDIKPEFALNNKASDDKILLAPTKAFKDTLEQAGMFLPSEQEEEIAKLVPTRGTEDAACFDLRANLNGLEFTINKGDRALIDTGFKVAMPKGTCAMVCSRSGLALKDGLIVLNAPGIIDSDYRGPIGVILFNTSQTPVTIKHGDRIAQLMFVKTSDLPLARTADFATNDTIRGIEGFGSTGKK